MAERRIAPGRPFRRRIALPSALIPATLAVLLLASSPASPQETFVFERMWPALQQPWYFTSPYVAWDLDKEVLYVVDPSSGFLGKFNKDGQLLNSWGRKGTGPGEFDMVGGIAVSSEGNVFISDGCKFPWCTTNRITKFSSEGELLLEFGQTGSGDGEFLGPAGLAFDSQDRLHVTDPGNNRVQVFDSDGNHLSTWDVIEPVGFSFENSDGIAIDDNDQIYVLSSRIGLVQKLTKEGNIITVWFAGPTQAMQAIAVDSEFVYIADMMNDRVKLFTHDGTPVSDFGTRDIDEIFSTPRSISVGPENSLWVGDQGGGSLSVKRFTRTGSVLSNWRDSSTAGGFFNLPKGVAVDTDQNIYVAEYLGHRVQKFSSNGVLLDAWGSEGFLAGQFSFPSDIAVDAENNVYVSEIVNDRIQKFDSSGNFLLSWGGEGTADGEMDSPEGIGIDKVNGFIYVADGFNHRVQKFTLSGNFETKWASPAPRDVAVDSNGDVHVIEVFNLTENRISKYSPIGDLILQWGLVGNNAKMAIDENDRIYVSDPSSQRIVVYSSTGEFIKNIGEEGSLPNQFLFPDGFALNASGDVIVADSGHNRIQVLERRTLPARSKAIIVAGGGPFDGNNLWSATEVSANFAYRALAQGGLTKESIFYLSASSDLDLDQNGVADDVDADSTLADLEFALTDIMAWGPGDVPDDVVVYLIDHGGPGQFALNETEVLDPATLDGWLDTLQGQITGRLTVVYDACQSGSFQAALAPTGGQNRIVITSTSATENAYFLSQGSVSFSALFWTNIFNGKDVADSFSEAVTGLTNAIPTQNPILVESPGGLSVGTFLGNGTAISQFAPLLTGVSIPQSTNGTSSATLSVASAVDTDGVARVWAVIQPPGFFIDPASSDNPVQELISVDLDPIPSTPSYEVTFDGFTIPGLYEIAIFARDGIGNVSAPEFTSVSSDSAVQRKAIVLVGAEQPDARFSAYDAMASRAYNALRFQGFRDEDIDFRTVSGIAGFDGAPSLFQLQSLLTDPGERATTFSLVLYLVGVGDFESFKIDADNSVTPATLDAWLDTLQNTTDGVPGPVTVVLDFDHSGSFVPAVGTPPAGRRRFVLAGTSGTQKACFDANGDISFSNYFWTRVLNGADLRSAFRIARASMRLAGSGQEAMLDDNGNGIPNEPSEGIFARRHRIGSGIRLAGEDPIGGIVTAPASIANVDTAQVTVNNLVSTGTVASVQAVVTPPYDVFLSPPAAIPLTDQGGGQWGGTLTGFNVYGPHDVSIVAIDTEGNISRPIEAVIKRVDGTDMHEPDDTAAEARWIGLNGRRQVHNFHDSSDVDYLEFFGESGETILIETSRLGATADTVVELLDTDQTTLLASDDNGSPSEDNASFLIHTLPSTGTFFVHVFRGPLGTAGADSDYHIFVGTEIAPNLKDGAIGGVVTADGSETVDSIDFIHGATITLIRDGATCDPPRPDCGRFDGFTPSPNADDAALPRYWAGPFDEATYTLEVTKPGFAKFTAPSFEHSKDKASVVSASMGTDFGEVLRDDFPNIAGADGLISQSEAAAAGVSTAVFNGLKALIGNDEFVSFDELLKALTVQDPGTLALVYVDFGRTAPEFATLDSPLGAPTNPFDTLAEGVASVQISGTVVFQAGATNETPTISKAVILEAIGGTVTIGTANP